MILDLDEWTCGHLAAAIRAHRNLMRQALHEVPGELAELEAAATRRAKTSQAATVLLESADVSHHGAMTLLLTKEQAAEALSLSPRTVQRLIAFGALPSVVIGRSRRITRDALDAFIEERSA